MNRASDSGSEGRAFESHRGHETSDPCSGEEKFGASYLIEFGKLRRSLWLVAPAGLFVLPGVAGRLIIALRAHPSFTGATLRGEADGLQSVSGGL